MNNMVSVQHKLETDIDKVELFKFRIHYRGFDLLRALNIKNKGFKKSLRKSDIFNFIVEKLNLESIVAIKGLDTVEAVLLGYDFNTAALTVPSTEDLGTSTIYFIDGYVEEEQSLMMTIITALHECKHVMQNKIGQLKQNTYLKPEEGFASYVGQPIEVSANNFALRNYKRFYKELIKDLR